jgi:hypothetical protein
MFKQVNPEALSNWVGHIPEDILQDIETIAPMLKKMGYSSNSDQPNYATWAVAWEKFAIRDSHCWICFDILY